MPDSPENFLQKTGNYRALHAYRKAEVLYDYLPILPGATRMKQLAIPMQMLFNLFNQ